MHRRVLATGVLAVAVATSLSACGGSADPAAPDGGGATTISAFLTEPTSLLPQRDTGSQVGMATCANLMEFNAETGELEPLVAESLSSEDNKTWTVTLRDWTFQDGSPVTAQTFVDTWSYSATGANGFPGGAVFSIVEGYDELNPAEGEPTADTLSGLEAVDDRTLQITLKAPNVDLPQALSTNSACPLPPVFFDDPEAYEANPIGNGPYQFQSWDHNVAVTLTKWADFPGGEAFTGAADTLVFKIYTDVEAAYSDFVAGNLDLIRNPAATLLQRAQADVGEDAVFQIEQQRQSVYLNVPSYVDKYASTDLRRALSLAIDRQALVDSVLRGQARSMDSLLIPLFGDTYRPGTCDACGYDPDAAKAALARAEADGFDGSISITYASGADDQIVEAISNQLQTTLGITVELKPLLPAQFGEQRNTNGYEGPAFGRWGLSYASPDQVLSQYVTGGEGNETTRYSNPEVDRLVEQALASSDDAERSGLYQQAEALVLADLPVIPLYQPNVYALQSSKVQVVSSQGDNQQYRARLRGA